MESQKTKIFFVIFSLLVLGAVGATYYRTFVARDYLVTMEVLCDPLQERCFVRPSEESSSSEVTEVTEAKDEYYKIVTKKASQLPMCAPGENDCPEPTCAVDELDCTESLCSEATVPVGERCNDPVVYRAAVEAQQRELQSQQDFDGGNFSGEQIEAPEESEMTPEASPENQ